MVLALNFGPSAGAAEPGERQLIADAQLTVGADGSVSRVALLRPEWPQALREAAEAQVGSLAFEPVRVDGNPARITSTIRFSACLQFGDDQVGLAMQPVMVGPQVAPEFAPYPLVGSRAFGGGGTFEFTLSFRVLADGGAQLDAVEAPALSNWRRKRIFEAYQDWFADFRFLPEQVDGTPVETRMN